MLEGLALPRIIVDIEKHNKLSRISMDRGIFVKKHQDNINNWLKDPSLRNISTADLIKELGYSSRKSLYNLLNEFDESPIMGLRFDKLINLIEVYNRDVAVKMSSNKSADKGKIESLTEQQKAMVQKYESSIINGKNLNTPGDKNV